MSGRRNGRSPYCDERFAYPTRPLFPKDTRALIAPRSTAPSNPPLVAGSVASTLVAGSAALVAARRFAAPAFDASKLYAVQSSSSNVVTIDRTTGTATTVLTAPTGPANNGSFQPARHLADGDKLYMTDSATVASYTASTNTWESTQRSNRATVGTTWVVSTRRAAVLLRWADRLELPVRLVRPGNEQDLHTPVTVPATGAPGGSGDLAFDRQGTCTRLELVRTTATRTRAAVRVNASDSAGAP